MGSALVTAADRQRSVGGNEVLVGIVAVFTVWWQDGIDDRESRRRCCPARSAGCERSKGVADRRRPKLRAISNQSGFGIGLVRFEHWYHHLSFPM